MKKTTLMFLFFTIITAAQNRNSEHYIAFSAAFDIKNSISGNIATNQKPTLDALYQFSMVGQNFEVNIGYENFNAICFDKYTVGVGYHFPLYGRIGGNEIRTILIPSIEPTLIGRWGTEWQTISSHLSIAVNIAFRWHITDDFLIETLINALPRTDLSTRYPDINYCAPIVVSKFIKLIYKIN